VATQWHNVTHFKTTGSDSYAKEVEFLTVRRGRMAGEAQEVVVL